MGLIGRILSFVRAERNGARISDVKTDPGGGPNVTAEHFGPPGDDGRPLPGDYVYGAPSPQRGRYAAVGYADPVSEPKAQPGEKRIYARNADGEVVAELWLKNDGAIEGINANGQFALEAGGAFVANGATMTTDGDVVTSDGISLRAHVHVGNLGANTSPPVP